MTTIDTRRFPDLQERVNHHAQAFEPILEPLVALIVGMSGEFYTLKGVLRFRLRPGGVLFGVAADDSVPREQGQVRQAKVFVWGNKAQPVARIDAVELAGLTLQERVRFWASLKDRIAEAAGSAAA